MILQKPDELVLVGKIGVQMRPDALGSIMLQAVVQPLVVTVVESLLLQVPLQVPIGLGDKEHVRMSLPHSGDKIRPVFSLRLGTGPSSPGSFKNGIHEQ